MSGIIQKISLLGREFTLQTEYVPGPEAKIRTLVYDGGRLVTNREIGLDRSRQTEGLIDERVREQHQRIVDNLLKRAGELLAAKGKTTAPPVAATPVPPPSPPEPKGRPRPTVEAGSRLDMAIATRQTMGPFGLAFARPAPATAEEFDKVLEAVEAAIDDIMRLPVYDQIRLDEQLTLIAIRGQLASWRLSGKELAVASEMWPSIEGFALHLHGISNRAELVAFDHELLTWAMSELGHGRVSDELVEGLRGLAGRDADLDHLLAHPEEMSQYSLLEVLLGLLDRTLV